MSCSHKRRILPDSILQKRCEDSNLGLHGRYPLLESLK